MAKIKVKIQDLFDRFGMNENPTENNKEISWKNEKDIKVKKPDGEFTNINEFVKKWCDSYKIIFSNNKELICSDKHILMTANGEKEVKNIDNDSILLSNGDYTNIKSIKLHKKNDILYDICIDYPHLFVDTNGLIHHNSLIVSYLIKILSENNEANQSLIIVPTLSLITQFKKDMIDYGIDKEKIGIANKDKKEFDSDIVVSTWQVLQNRKEILENFDLVICDECLDGNTNIKTPNGYKKIKDICIGDQVISYNTKLKKFEIDEIVDKYENLKKSTNEDMYEIEMENGESIEITGNHEVLTENGYKMVKNLSYDDEIIDIENYQ